MTRQQPPKPCIMLHPFRQLPEASARIHGQFDLPAHVLVFKTALRGLMLQLHEGMPLCCSCLSFHYKDRPSSKEAFELLKAHCGLCDCEG